MLSTGNCSTDYLESLIPILNVDTQISNFNYKGNIDNTLYTDTNTDTSIVLDSNYEVQCLSVYTNGLNSLEIESLAKDNGFRVLHLDNLYSFERVV